MRLTQGLQGLFQESLHRKISLDNLVSQFPLDNLDFYGKGGRGAPPYPPHEKKSPFGDFSLDMCYLLRNFFRVSRS